MSEPQTLREMLRARLGAFRVLPIFFFGGLCAIRVEGMGQWTGFAWALAAWMYARWLVKKGWLK